VHFSKQFSIIGISAFVEKHIDGIGDVHKSGWRDFAEDCEKVRK